MTNPPPLLPNASLQESLHGLRDVTLEAAAPVDGAWLERLAGELPTVQRFDLRAGAGGEWCCTREQTRDQVGWGLRKKR